VLNVDGRGRKSRDRFISFRSFIQWEKGEKREVDVSINCILWGLKKRGPSPASCMMSADEGWLEREGGEKGKAGILASQKTRGKGNGRVVM